MFQRILVPLDGSVLAEKALPMAARLARASGGSVILLRVVSPPVEYANGPIFLSYTPTTILEKVIGADMADAQLYLEGVAASGTLAGVHTQLEVCMGGAASEILSLTEAEHIDVIVMCTHGRTGLKRWLMGSVAQKMIQLSPVPVLVLHDFVAAGPGAHPYAERPLRVLVPLDGSTTAKAALAPAIRLAATLAAPGERALHLLRVVKPANLPGEMLDTQAKERILHKAKTYLQAVTSHLREGLAARLKVTVTWSVALDNDAADAIIRVAENGEDAEGAGIFGGCDIIALSTHGRGSFQHWVMGSVTERVLAGTTLPLLVMRPQEVEAEQGVGEAETKQAGVRV